MQTRKPPYRSGRPPLKPSTRLDSIISLRLTDDERYDVDNKAQLFGLTQSVYLRTILLQGSAEVRARPPKSHLDAAAKITEIASGITRLVRMAERRTPVPSQISEMVDAIHSAIRFLALELRGGAP